MRTIRRRVASEPMTVTESMEITEKHRGLRGRILVRRPWLAAGLAFALTATGCLQDSAGTGPTTGVASLAVTATVARGVGGATAAPVTALGVRAMYLRSAGDPVAMLEQEIPLGAAAPGSTVTQPLTLELGPCLADPQHLPGADSCRVLVRVTLLAGTTALDVVTIGPLDLSSGETAAPAEVTLHAVGTLAVTPGTPAPLFTGQSVQLTGTLSDATGAAVSGREIAWSTNAPAVATVDAAGKVTAAGSGTATITASGGDRTATVLVVVVPRPIIKLDKDAITVGAMHAGPTPEAQSVHIVNERSGTLAGLAVGSVVYGDLTSSGWLTATLSGSTAPATLTLRPSRTDLAPGTYTATVPLTAADAENSGVAVRVSYTVSPGTVIVLDQSQVGLGAPKGPSEANVKITTAEPLGGLAVGSVAYADSITGWLTATLSTDSTPATLTLRPSRTDLPPGSYKATVPLTAPGARNSGVEVQVSYTVSAPTLITVDQPKVEFNSPFGHATATVAVTSNEPLAGLTAQVAFAPYASGWLTAQLSSDQTPSNLTLEFAGTPLPGQYQADVLLSSPGAANSGVVQVVWTVPPDRFDFSVNAYPCYIYTGGPQEYVSDTVYVYTGLYEYEPDSGYAIPYDVPVPVTYRVLGPGLRLVSESGVTNGSDVIAIRTPGFVGEVQIEAVLGPAPHPPGALTDTVSVSITDSETGEYYCGEGTDARTLYTPGALPALRRAPGARPASPPASVSDHARPRVRRAAPASAPPASQLRSRFTPEHL